MQSVKVVILSMSTVAKFLCSELNLFLFCRVPDIIQKATYQKRLKRRYDAVFIQIPPLTKNVRKKTFGLSPQEEKLEQNFSMTQNANLASIGKKIDLNMNTSNWLFISDIEDGMHDIDGLGRRPYVLIIIIKNYLIHSCTFT